VEAERSLNNVTESKINKNIMNKLIFISLVALILPMTLAGQGRLDIDKPDALRILQEERMKERMKSDSKTLEGYRVLLYFSEDRSAAERVRSRFINEYSENFNCDLEWDEPKFKVYAGSFITRAEAVELLYFVREKFPNAMIVKTKLKSTR
jgi:hypothetical protein